MLLLLWRFESSKRFLLHQSLVNEITSFCITPRATTNGFKQYGAWPAVYLPDPTKELAKNRIEFGDGLGEKIIFDIRHQSIQKPWIHIGSIIN